MKTSNPHTSLLSRRLTPSALLTIGVLGLALGLSACGDIEYRCPLDPNKKPDSPTACAGMKEALAGAQRGTGGKLSVLVDDKGRLVPTALATGAPALPLGYAPGAAAGGPGPYVPATGEPVFREPEVFKVEASAFVDANGNLHDAHNAWFATPGRWSYGTVAQPGDSDDLLRPAGPGSTPPGKVVQDAGPGIKRPGNNSNPFGAPGGSNSLSNKTQSALANLSNVANSAVRNAQSGQAGSALASATSALAPSAPGVTAPAVTLGN
jgi:hypothetical protein